VPVQVSPGGHRWAAIAGQRTHIASNALRAETGLEFGAALRDNHALSAGARLGLLWQALPQWQMQAEAHGEQAFLGETGTQGAVSLEQSYALGKNSALRLRGSYRHYNNTAPERRLEFSWLGYF